MKNTFRLIPAVLAAIAVLAGCVQEITSPSFEKDKVNPTAESSRVIAVSFSQQTKTYLDKDGLQPKFEDGKDTVLISNTKALDTCVVSVKDNKATISTNLTGPLTAVYPYKAAKMSEGNENEIDTVLVSTEQSGKFADANICMAKMNGENDESLSFENKTAVFCIYPPTDNPEYVEVSAKNSNIANDVPTGSTHTSLETIHVAHINTDSVYVSILVPDGLKVNNLKFSDGTNEKAITTGARAAEAIAAGTLYTVTNANWESTEADIPNGALKGVFTVGKGADGIAGTADDVKVYFSKGNLQATYHSSSKSYTWAFAENQYDFVGGQKYNEEGEKTGNNTIDDQTDGAKVDLFGWSTESTTYGINTSVDNSTYSGNFKDWGTAIDDKGTWRTLSSDEWDYVFNKKGDGREDTNRYTFCKYDNGTPGSDSDDLFGLLLFPDRWSEWPEDCGEAPTYNRGTFPGSGGKTYTAEQICKLGEAGVVFLLAAGGRCEMFVQDVGILGHYWSNTVNETGTSRHLYIGCDKSNPGVFPNSGSSWALGNSVRLVTDVSAAPTPTEPTSAYVEIEADYDNNPSTANTTLKWYRQNLAITDSGNKKWKGGQTEAVKVPGTDKDVIVGDYFQWAAFSGYCGNESDPGKGLLVYDSFTNTCCVDGGSEDAFVFKSDKQFRKANAPYYSGSAYDKYTKINDEGDGKNLLEKADDVANIVLGDTWRMPTSAEFQAMKNATYWAWDGTNKGYYVFKPGQGTKGTAGGRGAINTATDNKADALLFFPAAGRGDNGTSLNFAGSKGYYWSSTLYSENTAASYSLDIDDSGVYPQYYNNRYYGYSVRPVSE